jgi:hypothetical protein
MAMHINRFYATLPYHRLLALGCAADLRGDSRGITNVAAYEYYSRGSAHYAL